MTHLEGEPIGNGPDDFSLGATIETTSGKEGKGVIVDEKSSFGEECGGELLLGYEGLVGKKGGEDGLTIGHLNLYS